MKTLAEAHQVHQAAVQHAEPGAPRPTPVTATLARSCARCGAPVPTGRLGAPHPSARYCSPACRLSDVRDRRAAARSDQLLALALLQESAAQILKGATQLQDAAERIERALRTLGLRPLKPRQGGARPSHGKESNTP